MEEGFDCSGLAVFTHAGIGIQIPRTARAQFKNRNKVTARNILPADLVFFSIPGKRKQFMWGSILEKISSSMPREKGGKS